MQERQIRGRQMAEPLQNVNVYTMIADVASQWFSVLTFTAAAVMLAYVVMSYLHLQQEYATTATLVILNAYEGMEDVIYYTDEYAQQNLNSSETASKLGGVMNSAELKGLVAKELRLDKFQGTVTSSLLGQSNILKVTVRAQTPYISYMECASIIKNYSKYSSELLGGIELSVLENPTVPERVERPFKILYNSLLAGAGAFAAICALLAFLSYMRDTVRSRKEAESKIDAPLLEAVPFEKKHRKFSLRIGKHRRDRDEDSILITDPLVSFKYSESIRKLAVRLMNEMSDKGMKVLLISSCAENEGKSTTAVNIALAMSQSDRKVVLVDMDFRKPADFKILNAKEEDFRGLEEYLRADKKKGEDVKTSTGVRNDEEIRSLMYRIPGTNLDAVLMKKALPQAAEQYASGIRRVLAFLREEADIIIVDTVPVSLVSDAEELAPMADGSVIVVRQHYMEAGDINDCIDSLGGKRKVLGSVYNFNRTGGFGMKRRGYGYGYGYGYGGRYAGHYAKR